MSSLGLEWKFLRFTGVLAAIFGQFPVKNLGRGMSTYKILSVSGIWGIFLFLVNVILAQTSISGIIVLIPKYEFEDILIAGNGTEEFRLSSVNSKLMLFQSCLHLFTIYAIYITHLVKLPIFLEVYKKLRSFDEQFPHRTRDQTAEIFGMIIFQLIWWTEASLGIVSCMTSNKIMRNKPLTYQRFVKLAWIFKIFSSIQVSDGTIVWLGGIHLFLCHFSIGFAVQHILSISYMIGDRLIEFERSIPHNFELQNGNAIELELCISKIIQLKSIFKSLKKASKCIIFILISICTICVIILTFVGFNTMDYYFTEFYLVPLTMGLYLFLYFLKLIWLTNCGERLSKRSKSLQEAIYAIRITNSYKKSKETLSYLKQISMNLDFQLSGYGYFQLNRSALTSIISSVITYNVVLLQFQNSELGEKKLYRFR